MNNEKIIYYDHPKGSRAAEGRYIDDCAILFIKEEFLRQDGINLANVIKDLCTKYQMKFSASEYADDRYRIHDGWRASKLGEITLKIAFPKPVDPQAMQDTLLGLAELSCGETLTSSPAPESEVKPVPKPLYSVYSGAQKIGEAVGFTIDQTKAKAAYSPLTGIPTELDKQRQLDKDAKEQAVRELAVLEPDPLMDRGW